MISFSCLRGEKRVKLRLKWYLLMIQFSPTQNVKGLATLALEVRTLFRVKQYFLRVLPEETPEVVRPRPAGNPGEKVFWVQDGQLVPPE